MRIRGAEDMTIELISNKRMQSIRAEIRRAVRRLAGEPGSGMRRER